MATRAKASSPPRLADLSQRMRQVLISVLEEYVETGQPVGSRALSEHPDLAVSPATLRAAMSELAALDLLDQAHSSAGRVPTELAFRAYVDHLLEQGLEEASNDAVDGALAPSDASVEERLRNAARVLSRVTGQLGFFAGMSTGRLVLDRVVFTRVSSERVMALIVSRAGAFETRVFEESDSEPRMLERASSLLSEFVAGLTLRAARSRLVDAVERERERKDALWRRTFLLGRAGLAAWEPAELYVGDSNYLIAQPEFADVLRLRELMAALDEKEKLLGLVDRVLAQEPNVAIGDELADAGVQGCALVTAPLDGVTDGGVGVIGPVRMHYARVIPTVRYLSRYVSAQIV